jgi:hypothetical protein
MGVGGVESQESLIRQEELKQRKNRIIQLLNGEISDEDGNGGGGVEDCGISGGDVIDQSSGNGDGIEYGHI